MMPRRLLSLFPLAAIGAGSGAYLWPAPFARAGGAIVPLLMLVMLGMGCTLTPADFRAVLRAPRLVLLGVGLHYTVMPAAAWLVIRVLQLDAATAVGVVLVGATSAGTASNVISYLARGNVALSVTLTAASTLLAVVLMPLIASLMLARTIEVPAGAMVLALAQVAVGPVAAGMVLRRLAGARSSRILATFPAVSALAIVAVIAIVVGLNAPRLAVAGPAVLGAVALHNGIGLAAGYGLARLANADEASARTIAIEVGMQNSGLSVALALKLFTPAAALPGAIFSVWHNLTGSALAAFWARRPPQPPAGTVADA
ncbi:MAG TPA: bile acid:sodium symporter family protein [Steroidobacteraceae bacterium]|nr:bile acid:sodium symporter family protein [Steroidobacteraceae bacterium]